MSLIKISSHFLTLVFTQVLIQVFVFNIYYFCLVIIIVFGGFGLLFFGSICFICSLSIGKSFRKTKPPDIIWDSLGSGLEIDLRSHLDPNQNTFSNHFDDEIITRAKRLQRPEETLLLLQDDEEEDL